MSEISGTSSCKFWEVSSVHRGAVTMLLLVGTIFIEKAQVIINVSQYTETEIPNKSAEQK